jgi:hypothetical protein
LDVVVAAPGRAGLVLGHGGLLALFVGKGDADFGFVVDDVLAGDARMLL